MNNSLVRWASVAEMQGLERGKKELSSSSGLTVLVGVVWHFVVFVFQQPCWVFLDVLGLLSSCLHQIHKAT